MRYIILVICTLNIIACQANEPDESPIQTSIAQTEVANDSQAVNTPVAISSTTPKPSNTPEPTFTSTPAPTPTVTPSPTLDTRLIFGDPEACLGIENHKPFDIYSFDKREEVTNGILKVRYKGKGPEYVETTGRLTGWINSYSREQDIETLPFDIVCETEIFETHNGAIDALLRYDASEHGFPLTQYILLDIEYEFSQPIQYTVLESITSTGWHIPVLEFVYRNLEITIRVLYFEEGYEDESFDILKQIAEIVLDRLEKAELSGG